MTIKINPDVTLIEWNNPSSGVAIGTYASDSVSTDGIDSSASRPDSFSSYSTSIQVAINGSNVTITGELLPTLSGTISGDQMHIEVPPTFEDGSIQSELFTASSPSQYNADVATVKQVVSRANYQAAQNQTAEKLESQTQGDVTTMNNALASLQSDVSRENQDMAPLSQLTPGAPEGDPCSNTSVQNAQDAVSAVEDDQNNASSDASELSSDIATVRNDIAQLQNVGLTGQFYTSAQSAVSNDIAQANSVISEANQDSSNALTQGDAGFEGCTDWYPGSGSSPIQPLS